MSDSNHVALVTGATGFVGRHLVSSLQRDGWQVVALVRPTSDVAHLYRVETVTMPGSASELAAVVATIAPAVVWHLATCFRGRHRAQDVEPLVAANVLLGTQLAEALAAAPPSVLVNVGSAWQRDAVGAYRPAALYAATKQAMEDILRYYAESGAFQVADVKLFDTYGPDDGRGKLLSQVHRASITGEALAMSPGEQLIDLLYVDDAVKALRFAATAAVAAAEPWQSWSASSGEARRVRDVIALFEAVTCRSVPLQWGALPYRAREMFEPWQAGDLVPGWFPEVPLEEGIRLTWGSGQ